MESGTLRHRVAIEARAETRDADGDLSDIGWNVLYADMPCDIKPLSARDMRLADAEQSEVTATLRIRFTPELIGFKSRLRARRLDDGRIYDLSVGIEDNRDGRSWLTFNAKQGVTNG